MSGRDRPRGIRGVLASGVRVHLQSRRTDSDETLRIATHRLLPFKPGAAAAAIALQQTAHPHQEGPAWFAFTSSHAAWNPSETVGRTKPPTLPERSGSPSTSDSHGRASISSDRPPDKRSPLPLASTRPRTTALPRRELRRCSGSLPSREILLSRVGCPRLEVKANPSCSGMRVQAFPMLASVVDYSLGHRHLQFQLLGRRSFRHLACLRNDSDIPDGKTIWKHRVRLTKSGRR